MLRKQRLFLAGLYFTYFKKIFRNKGISIHVPFHLTDYKFRGRFVMGTYEKEEATYLSKYLSPNSSVLELGACLGYVSCLTNVILEDKTKHVVLEANPNLIPWIQKNKEENDCSFSIEHAIISNRENNSFYIHDLIVGGSVKRKTQQEIIVRGLGFDDLEEKYKLKFNTLIMDIEGGELELLRNQQDGLWRFNQIFMEVHPFANILSKEEGQECEDILCSLGFQPIVRDGNFLIWEQQDLN